MLRDHSFFLIFTLAIYSAEPQDYVPRSISLLKYKIFDLFMTRQVAWYHIHELNVNLKNV